MKRAVRSFLSAILLAGIVFLLLGLLPPCTPFVNSRRAKATRCRDALLDLGSGIQAYAEFHHGFPPTSSVTGCSQVRSHADLIGHLSGKNGGPRFYSFDARVLQTGVIVDPWGSPIHVQLPPLPVGSDSTRTLDLPRVVLWSSGPNRRDELGAGDDILVEVKCYRSN